MWFVWMNQNIIERMSKWLCSFNDWNCYFSEGNYKLLPRRELELVWKFLDCSTTLNMRMKLQTNCKDLRKLYGSTNHLKIFKLLLNLKFKIENRTCSSDLMISLDCCLTISSCTWTSCLEKFRKSQIIWKCFDIKQRILWTCLKIEK